MSNKFQNSILKIPNQFGLVLVIEISKIGVYLLFAVCYLVLQYNFDFMVRHKLNQQV